MSRANYRRTGRLQSRPSLLAAFAVFAATLGAAGSESLLLLGARSEGSRRVIMQDEWALSLADILGFDAALGEHDGGPEAFGLLCPDQLERVTDSGGRRVGARSPLDVPVDLSAPRRPGEGVRVVVNIPAPALYRLSVEGAGAQRWSVDGRTLDHLDPAALGVAHASLLVPLRSGPHELTAQLGRGARVDRAELNAYRALCLAPAEGWRGGQPLRDGDRARTLVQAMGVENRLPAAGAAIEIEGERFESASAWGARSGRRLEDPASADGWAVAAGSPAEFTYRIRLNEPGVFSIEARVKGDAPQVWSIDGRYRIVLHPQGRAGGLTWNFVAALPLAAGIHAIRTLVARTAGIDVIRLVPRRASDSDYMTLAESLGLSVGAPGRLVTRSRADADLSHPAFLHAVGEGAGANRLVRGVAARRPDAPLPPGADNRPLGPMPLPPVIPSEI